MKSVGEILKEGRKEKRLSLEKVAESTKIRLVYLKALENDQYSKLPSLTSGRGFLKNYADFLELSSDEILAIFRRDFNEKKDKRDSLEIKPPSSYQKFSWTPKLTTWMGIGVLIFIFLAYLIWQFYSLINAPYYR